MIRTSGQASRRTSGKTDLGVVLLILFTILGLGGATYVFLQSERFYQSEAKLLIRYVVDLSQVDSHNVIKKRTEESGNVVAVEKEILTSLDLAREVAESFGAERLAPGQADEAEAVRVAAGVIQDGLEVRSQEGTAVIRVIFTHPEAPLVTELLKVLIERYFERHIRIHRPKDTRLVMEELDLARVSFRAMQAELDKRRADPASEEAAIRELERQLGVAEEKVKFMTDALWKARIDEALDAGNIPNIAIIQSPSDPVEVRDPRARGLMLALGLGGPLLGLVLAILTWVSRIVGAITDGRGRARAAAGGE